MTQEKYHEHAYMQAYTDESATNATKNKYIFIYKRYMSTRKFCSHFSTDAQAIEQAANKT